MNRNPQTAFDNFIKEMTGDLAKTTIGFGKVFDGLRTAIGTYDSYPPFNFEQTGDAKYRIVFALAGFTKEDIVVEVNGNWLTIAGDKKSVEEEKRVYLHQGIAMRSFKRLVQIADDIEVKNAVMNDGLLSIDLEQVIPDAKKAKIIKIK